MLSFPDGLLEPANDTPIKRGVSIPAVMHQGFDDIASPEYIGGYSPYDRPPLPLVVPEESEVRVNTLKLSLKP